MILREIFTWFDSSFSPSSFSEKMCWGRGWLFLSGATLKKVNFYLSMGPSLGEKQ